MPASTHQPFDLQGRVALVTGAASGIGQAVCASLLECGMRVGGLDLTAEGVPAGCETMIADVRDTAAVTGAVDAFARSCGRLDLLVGNAGVSFAGTIEDGTEEDWHRLFDINVFGQMRVLRAALPWLRRAHGASVVIMSSCSAINGIPRRVLYAASKGAVHSMTLALAVDLLGEGIRVNAIAPGTVDTPFIEGLIEEAEDPATTRAAYETRQPTGRMVDPGEVARAVAYLASPQSRSTTGTTLVIDGGMNTLRPRPMA